MIGDPGEPVAGDVARVTVGVAVPPAECFRLFTEEIDRWWRRGRRFRNAPGERGLIAMEPREGGRVFESFEGPAGEVVHEIGRVTTWQPPHRLVFEWRASNFAPNEHTEVELQFEPSPSGTRVTLVHRGWAAIRADHPVRHGLSVPAFVAMMGRWWGDQLMSLRMLAAGEGPR